MMQNEVSSYAQNTKGAYGKLTSQLASNYIHNKFLAKTQKLLNGRGNRTMRTRGLIIRIKG